VPVVIMLALAGCGGSSLRVTNIQIGRSVNADGTVGNHTPNFGPGDAIHLSVFTSGVGSGTIKVRWLYRGRQLDETEKKVSYTDVAATPFTLKTVAGFPPGDYSAEVFLDGQPAGTRTFRVEAQ
jgi:hypothetical protein